MFIIVSAAGSVFPFADAKEISLAHPIGKDNALIIRNNVQPYLVTRVTILINPPDICLIVILNISSLFLGYPRGCLLVLLLFYHMDRGITINILVRYSGEYLAQWQVVSEMLHIRLCVEAVGRFATHFEALLTAGIVGVRDAMKILQKYGGVKLYKRVNSTYVSLNSMKVRA